MHSIASLDGCHATVFLLSTGGRNEDADGSPSAVEFFHGCLGTFLQMCQSCNAGLCNSYISIIADSQTQNCFEKVKVAFRKWHCLAAPLFKTPLHLKDKKAATTAADPMQIHYDFTALEDILTMLASRGPKEAVSGSEEHSVPCYQGASEMATQLHSLLDAVPWKSTGYVVLDVYWLVSGSVGYSPSSAVQLYGAFLRLKKWNNAHIQIISSKDKLKYYIAKEQGQKRCDTNVTVTPRTERTIEVLLSQMLEWKEVLGAPLISTQSDWCVSAGMIWRGAVRFTEHKVPRQAHPQVVAFPGFALTLLPTPWASCWAGTDLLAGVGLKGGRPSHLEVVQVVNEPTVPLFWLSPLHCVLSLEDTSFPDSVALFSELFTAKAKQSIGLIMRLCLTEKDAQQGQHSTTADWMGYIQDSELEDASTPSPLDSFLPGPLLLVYPCDQAGCRCDAWFLWKPESIRANVFSQLEGQSSQIAEDAMDTDLLRELPLIQLTPDHSHTTTDRDSDATGLCAQQNYAHQLSLFTHELDLPPCKCPEMMALQTHEWIQRKMIRRLATPDFMFGQVLVPPPSTGTKEAMDAGDVLSCFTETGSPAISELSPIAMNDPTRMMKIHDPSTGDVSYHSIMASTPSSKKHYHGVNYCLTDGNTLDARLTRIQQCYLVSERASNCSTSNTPKSNRLRRCNASRGPQSTSEASNKVQRESNPSNATASSTSLAARNRNAPPKMIKKIMSPVVKVTKVSKVKRLGQKIKPIKINESSEKGDTCRRLPSGDSSTFSAPTSHQSPTNRCPNESQQKTSTTLQDTATVKLHVDTRDCLDSVSSTSLDAATKTFTLTQGLRRSPRKNKWQLGCSPSKQEKQSQRRKKSEQRKRQLEDVIVATLKANNLRRSHPCFRKCYTRLFTLSKSFLKDMKTTKGLMEEMKKVAEFNVSQVIDFELRQAGMYSPIDSSSLNP